MLIVPEIQTVVILVPRTGSGTLRNALLAKYPKAMMLYRHMEADGVPLGYDRWRRLGVVRQPIERLWSLYKYCSLIGGEADPVSGRFRQGYVQSLRESVEHLSFNQWLEHNELPFTHPYETGGAGFYPVYNQLHSYPENRKSQFIYLRPDLGTEVFRFDRLPGLFADLGLEPPVEREHETERLDHPRLSLANEKLLRNVMGWDFQVTGN